MDEATRLTSLVSEYAGRDGERLVVEALSLAEERHKGKLRYDGTPYVLHSIGVATILAQWSAPPEIVVAGLLHDILKPNYSNWPHLADIEVLFEPSITSLIKEVAQIDIYSPALEKSITGGNKDKAYDTRLLWSTAMLQKSPKAMVVKIADRLHNLTTLDKLPAERKEAFATNALHIFASLAHRLGMGQAMTELQDYSFRVVDPEGYNIADNVYQLARSSQEIVVLVDSLQKTLNEQNLKAEVVPYLTHRYGIHRKRLERSGRTLSPIEILSLNVITESVDDCYRVLRIIHHNYQPLNEVRDHIAIPKPNGYRALQTHVLQPSLGVLQISIQTREMHLVAEYGIVAEWLGVSKELLPKVATLEPAPEGWILILTPRGDIKHLPRNATPVDFAYSIHPGVGHSCMRALVNGTWTPLDAPLQYGDVVDIIVGRGVEGPDPQWESFVVTDLAKQAIASWTRRRRKVEIHVEAWDRIGLLQEITTAISSKGLNIRLFNATVFDEGKASITFQLAGVGESDQNKIRDEIQAIPHIVNVSCKTPELAPQLHPVNTALSIRENPFSTQRPAVDNFKGREEEKERIIRRLRGRGKGNALLIWGQRRIGKTSLLKHLELQTLPSQRYLPVYVNLQDVPNQPIGFFLHRIAKKIEEKIQHEEIHAPVANRMKREPIYYFQSFIESIRKFRGPLTLLIILDEFQGIGRLREEGATREDVFLYFRNLIQHDISITFLLCGGGVLKRLMMQSGLGSLLSVVDPIKIECLEREDAKALIAEPASWIEYTDEGIERLLEITGCHPCYIQHLCRDLYEKAIADRRKIDLSDVEDVIHQQLQWHPKLESLVDHFWIMDLEDKGLIRQNNLVLSAIADSDNSSRWAPFTDIARKTSPFIKDIQLLSLLDDLVDYGSIERQANDYRIKIPILEQWLRVMYPLQQLFHSMKV